jgi:hypothetical protein
MRQFNDPKILEEFRKDMPTINDELNKLGQDTAVFMRSYHIYPRKTQLVMFEKEAQMIFSLEALP